MLECLAFVPLCLAVFLNHPGDAPYSDHGKRSNGTPQSATAPAMREALPYLACDRRYCAPYTLPKGQDLTGDAISSVGGHNSPGHAVAGKGWAAAVPSGTGTH